VAFGVSEDEAEPVRDDETLPDRNYVGFPYRGAGTRLNGTSESLRPGPCELRIDDPQEIAGPLDGNADV
jgi:hypothetical protein